jgi:hypothetical protein
MAVERIDLAGSLSLEPTAPVSSAPAMQDQATLRQEEGKPRRRSTPEEALFAEAALDENNKEEDEGEEGTDSGQKQPPHRLDDLA